MKRAIPRLALLLSTLLAALAAGCGGGASCDSICERAQSLGCGSATCVSTCTSTRSEAARIGCSGEWQQLANCTEEHACEATSSACRDQEADAVSCVAGYCVRNPTDSVCTSSP